jgi:hypothetical protein
MLVLLPLTAFQACDDIASDAKITLDQLKALNPWVGTDCDTAVFANLGTDSQSYRPVCIGTGSGTVTITSGASTTSATIGPTQTGIASTCTRFYTVPSGGSCGAIEDTFHITFAQFFA